MRFGRILHRLERRLLQRVYGFDSWHVGHAYEPYVSDIVRYLNSRPEADRETVVEIGCGLGDILRSLRFRTRLGLDRDAGVVSAARVLAFPQFRADLRFQLFTFPDAELSGTYNAIVMVNWIHQVDPEHLHIAIQTYFQCHLRPGGVLVLDTVQDPAYTYNHDARRLAPSEATVDHLGTYQRHRDLWVLSRHL